MVDGWTDTAEKEISEDITIWYSDDDLVRRLWNADETGLCLNATSQTVLTQRGTKSVYKIGRESGREYITVLGHGSADGLKLQPLVVYKN